MSENDPPRRPPRQLDRARRVAGLLDRRFRIPGTSFRFGLDPIIGLLPVGGDALAALASGYILYVAWLNGAPGATIGRMMGNVLLDTLVGAVPVVGDLFDAAWHANSRNVALLEEWLGEEGSQGHHSAAILVAVLVGLLVLLAAVVALAWVVLETLL
ncbi:MAG TPA: DUF4112 domain-containing protein [Longimicrobiales bacterium]|nr:DUF4112 domain-containing protein [Longimicrobiales bacterium]